MARFFYAVLLFLFWSPGARAVDPLPITEADNVFAIYTEDWGLAADEGPQLIFALWGDGTMVWSDDTLAGGAPYYSAKLPPETLSNTLTQLEERGLFDTPKLGQAHWGPDSSFTKILVRKQGKELAMTSWHELYEANGKVIAAAGGLTGLNGAKLLPTLAKEPADYLHYRMTWLELRLAAANLILKEGARVAGEATMKARQLTWTPDAEP